jgi:hypothetical protein
MRRAAGSAAAATALPPTTGMIRQQRHPNQVAKGTPSFRQTLYLDRSLSCSARAAPMALVTWRRSSGGGRTAFRPSD